MRNPHRTPQSIVNDLVEKHGSLLHQYIAVHESDPSTVDDIWADVFEIVWKKIDELDGLDARAQAAWLVSTGRQLLANHGRRMTTRRRVISKLSSEPVDVSDLLKDPLVQLQSNEDTAERSAQLRTVLDNLSDHHRRVLVLDALGNNGKQIAEILGVSHSSARKQLMTARQLAREIAASELPQPEGRP